MCYLQQAQTVWFVKVVNIGIPSENIIDNYRHCILKGNNYIEGKYLELDSEKKHVKVYKEMNKVLYCYNTSVVYHLVNWETSQKGDRYLISNIEINDVVSYMQYSGLQYL